MSWLTDIFSRRPKLSQNQAIDFYRSLGFFASQPNNSALLEQFAYEHYGEPYNPDKRFDDVYLLPFDGERVWCGDPECDVCDENQVYAEVLNEWAAIADGLFAPQDIGEKWNSETGPTTVSFRQNGKQYELHPEWHDDYLDLSVLEEINRIVQTSGRSFACFSDVNYAIVFVVTDAQRQQLLDVRNFPFTI